ncbi:MULTISPECIES: GNAT family N-acetyltransferase [Streptomyces]|uniref:GNAT family N-acetyltransferase n=1 Tax=Streptomyces californicus TaxID=67351 RepID=A0ABD7CR92_9ACTN|nr:MULTISPECIES: GNAT family N-acetyltransferase [Streptomyces]KOG83644.1 GCN5 family acetyltransferase [Streptomyces griseus subsp. rhodochrous]KOU49575.1 GCN5 family acetyltransferase [Streptomyces sp. MMG1522]QRV30849.1 GNAT family N-acetyltransferase [Streptomyces californicus]QRV33542.1 GNAT family N-acetyltransferase [Streptomyces californicus]QRV44264.1 GNAT family N-acetyltransferase [Streptomyces californicus]
MTDLVIRALTTSDAHLFHALQDASLVGRGAFGHRYAPVAEGGEYRPDWTWVALRDGTVVARAAWWAAPDDTAPVALDWFDFADGEEEAGAELLRRSPLRAEFSLLVPPGWREMPEVRAAAEARIDAARAAGMEVLVERYRYEWTPDCPLPERPGRLTFRPEPDDAVILDVLRRCHSVTLDAHARRAIAGPGGLDAAAQAELDIFHWFPSPREWWQLAFTPDGEVAGIHVPAHNPNGPCIGFIGVVPEARGHGYGYDLLVECTRFLVERGAESIAGATDRGNTPMAAAFARAGHPVAQERIDLV